MDKHLGDQLPTSPWERELSGRVKVRADFEEFENSTDFVEQLRLEGVRLGMWSAAVEVDGVLVASSASQSRLPCCGTAQAALDVAEAWVRELVADIEKAS